MDMCVQRRLNILPFNPSFKPNSECKTSRGTCSIIRITVIANDVNPCCHYVSVIITYKESASICQRVYV